MDRGNPYLATQWCPAELIIHQYSHTSWFCIIYRLCKMFGVRNIAHWTPICKHVASGTALAVMLLCELDFNILNVEMKFGYCYGFNTCRSAVVLTLKSTAHSQTWLSLLLYIWLIGRPWFATIIWRKAKIETWGLACVELFHSKVITIPFRFMSIMHQNELVSFWIKNDIWKLGWGKKLS